MRDLLGWDMAMEEYTIGVQKGMIEMNQETIVTKLLLYFLL